MNRFLASLLLSALLCVSSGCATQSLILTAKGSSHRDENGKIVVDEKPQPAAYAFVPFTVIADILMLPLYGVGWICIGTGLYHDP